MNESKKYKKIHKKIIPPDCRDIGQTDYEFTHTAMCGYVRERVTLNNNKVTCKLCIREMMKDEI